MPIHESPAARGARRSRFLAGRVATDLGDARRRAGLSQREVGRQLGVDHRAIAALERGDPTRLTIDLVSRMAAAVGLQFAASLHPDGDPVRDRGHLALIHRFLGRLSSDIDVRLEVPIPLAGDRRSADIVLGLPAGRRLLVEAETHLDDIQAMERSMSAKQRDLALDRAILLVSDTRHNRTVLRTVQDLAVRYPVDTRTCLRALGRGLDPGADGLVIL